MSDVTNYMLQTILLSSTTFFTCPSLTVIEENVKPIQENVANWLLEEVLPKSKALQRVFTAQSPRSSHRFIK